MMSFRGEFTVTNRPFEEGYADPTSRAFHRLATNLEKEVRMAYVAVLIQLKPR